MGNVTGDGGAALLLYIPTREQLDKMTFADLVDNGKVIYSAADQKNDFWAFEDSPAKHIGEYSKRGGAVMPWQHMVNFKFSQDFYINIKGKRNTITLGLDVNNLANLINRNWCGIDRLESSQILKYNTKTNAYNFTKPVWSKYAARLRLGQPCSASATPSTKSPKDCNAKRGRLCRPLFIFIASYCYSSLRRSSSHAASGFR